MKYIVQQIRNYLNITQERFAKELSTTFATVNRWEQGHTTVNKLSQLRLYEYCIKNNIPVYDMILSKIRDINTNISMKLKKDRILLYHGSKNGINEKIQPISRSKCDFGKGFYMGTNIEQPLTLICDFEQSKFYIVSVNLKKLKRINISQDINWAMLIAYNRGKMASIQETKFYLKYANMLKDFDIVIGDIADDRMFYVLDNFFLGSITDLALIKSLSALQLGKQYVAITQKACNNIKIEKEIELSLFEKKIIQKISSEDRTKGICLANDICKGYRRKGLFFDEILDKAKGDNKVG